MDITPYVESLRHEWVAAAGGGDDVERLTRALDAAARLALMEAVSQAAAEITAELPAGSVDVRLRGRDLAFVVEGEAHAPAPPPPPAPPAPPEDEQGTARITLRLPDTLKTRAEESAVAAGQSLNTWLVAAVRRATGHPTQPDVDLSSRPISEAPLSPFGGRGGSRRISGWL